MRFGSDRMKRKLWFYVQLTTIALSALYLLLKFGRYPGFDYSSTSIDGGSEGSAQQHPPTSHGYEEVVVHPPLPPFPTATTDPADKLGQDELRFGHNAGQKGDGLGKPLRLDGSEDEATTTNTGESSAPTGSDGVNETALETARRMIPSILDPNDESVPRMSCPEINGTRYDYLKGTRYKRKHHYLIAINLRQCVELLPRLLGSVMEVIEYLGPEQVVLSIVEGNSDDGTAEVLDLLRSHLKTMGVVNFVRHSNINPSEEDRIGRLAQLRDLAVKPLSDYGKLPAKEKAHAPTISQDEKDNEDPGPSYRKRDEHSGEALEERSADAGSEDSPRDAKEPKASKDAKDAKASQAAKESKDANRLAEKALNWSEEPVVIFLNDVSACAEDILELVHQRLLQKADMTCAMDWTHRPFAAFYDVWVSRTMAGDLFFSMPGGSWDYARLLFPTEPVARSRFQAHRPFQVFSCWNGATVFTGVPLLKGEVHFRKSLPEECFQGEVQLFCKDMWFKGYGRIAVVPSVNLEYTDARGRETKDELGYTSTWVSYEDDEVLPIEIDWKGPPEQVLCMPEFHRQSWLPWNESLPLP